MFGVPARKRVSRSILAVVRMDHTHHNLCINRVNLTHHREDAPHLDTTLVLAASVHKCYSSCSHSPSPPLPPTFRLVTYYHHLHRNLYEHSRPLHPLRHPHYHRTGKRMR